MNTKLMLFVGAAIVGYVLASSLASSPVFDKAFAFGAQLGGQAAS